MVWHRLMIDGNAVYEIDESCKEKKEKEKQEKQSKSIKNLNENKRK